MAEQDRKDLVPSVLNDLIDVDGTPTEGQSLTFQNGVWSPSAGLIPNNGSLLNVWDGPMTLLANTIGYITAEPTDQTVTGYAGTTHADLAAPLPRFGHWVNDGGNWGFQFDYPGIYDIEFYLQATLSAAANDSRLSARPGNLTNFNNGRSRNETPYPSGATSIPVVAHASTLWISPDMVEDPYLMTPSGYWQRPTGSVTITSAYMEWTVWQRSPGAS